MLDGVETLTRKLGIVYERGGINNDQFDTLKKLIGDWVVEVDIYIFSKQNRISSAVIYEGKYLQTGNTDYFFGSVDLANSTKVSGAPPLLKDFKVTVNQSSPSFNSLSSMYDFLRLQSDSIPAKGAPSDHEITSFKMSDELVAGYDGLFRKVDALYFKYKYDDPISNIVEEIASDILEIEDPTGN